MKLKYTLWIGLSIVSLNLHAQKWTKPATLKKSDKIERPKLVVGIMVDQMRWDYLYRFYNRYGNGGFKRLINEGFSLENTFIPYTPTATACGHTCVYTGSVPAIHGIIGNEWYDPDLGKKIYCAEDESVDVVGSSSKAGGMSPKNLWVTTVTDELRLATNFKSKVIGIALKDRASIFPAGHTANAAYYYDSKTGNWVTTTHYMKELPQWVVAYNQKKMTNQYYAKEWNTLYPIETYTQSDTDDKPWESKFWTSGKVTFPHLTSKAIDKNFGLISGTPYGNTMTLDISKVAIDAEKLGQTENTDFLALSCSATDYIGHGFGPNSIEVEDTYLRLDKDLSDFFSYLDTKVGKGQYLVFLTADHAVANAPGFVAANKLPGGVAVAPSKKDLDSLLKLKFNLENIILSVSDSEIYFDQNVIQRSKVNFSEVKEATISFLIRQPGIQDAIDMQQIGTTPLPAKIKEMLINGHNARRSGDIYFIRKSNWVSGATTGTSHGSWYPYDSHIPLLFMGWHIKQGKTNNTHYMTDISATLAALLHIQMPSGCVGTPITEITN